MEEQLAELQMLLMELQRSLEDMSRQLIAHDTDLNAMNERVEKLETRLKYLIESMPGPETVADEKPPHY